MGVIALALGLCGILVTMIELEPMCSNSKLLGSLCEERHNAVVVMDNQHFYYMS